MVTSDPNNLAYRMVAKSVNSLVMTSVCRTKDLRPDLVGQQQRSIDDAEEKELINVLIKNLI